MMGFDTSTHVTELEYVPIMLAMLHERAVWVSPLALPNVEIRTYVHRAYGIVYEVKHLQSDRRRAAKAIAKSRLLTERDVADVQREMQVRGIIGVTCNVNVMYCDVLYCCVTPMAAYFHIYACIIPLIDIGH